MWNILVATKIPWKLHWLHLNKKYDRKIIFVFVNKSRTDEAIGDLLLRFIVVIVAAALL